MRKAALLLSSMLLTTAVLAAEVNVPPTGGGADVTVYNGDLALVREQRTFRLPAVTAQLAFSWVSSAMQPETALLDVTKGDALKIIEQNFNFNTISQQTLLERAIGQQVTIFVPNAAGLSVPVRAKVLAADGPVFEIDGKIHTGIPGRIVFDTLPAGVRASPTLLLSVTGAANKDVEAELSYLTGGLSWKADYVMNYDADAARMDLTGWATVTNTTGATFNNARLKLVAGDINRVSGPMRPQAMRMQEKGMVANAAMADGFTEGEVEGSHVYAMGKSVTLGDKETKQLSLLGAKGIATTRELVVRNNQPYIYQSVMRGQVMKSKAAIELAFKNDAASKLGVPLPAGVMRVYGMDEQGAAQFLGESPIGHTAEGAEARLTLGRDFDVDVDREQTNFVHAADTINVSVWKVTVKNAKARPLKVRLIEPMPSSWEITKESHPHKNANAGSTEWLLDVPAKGQTVLEYNVKSTH